MESSTAGNPAGRHNGATPADVTDGTPERQLHVMDARAYRVFVSYSHQDEELVTQVVRILDDIGLAPMWDRNFAFGEGFHDQIKIFIEHAHVFMPILTTTADSRNWVHQEIGFAMAHNIPVLPIAVDKLPDEMIRHIQALQVDRSQIDRLRLQLTRDSIRTLIERRCTRQSALYSCADTSERRARLMTVHAKDVVALGYAGLVRQKGGLSSFHIPTEIHSNPVWKERYGSYAHSDEHCRLQRGERLALTEHAKVAGCRLIVNPYLDYGAYGDRARLVRLRCLLTFLEGMPDRLCAVAIHNNMNISESVTMVGNWFSAESVSAVIGKGYLHTIFTRHAPTLVEKTSYFDEEFAELLSAQGTLEKDSRLRAIAVLSSEIEKLRRILEPVTE